MPRVLACASDRAASPHVPHALKVRQLLTECAPGVAHFTYNPRTPAGECARVSKWSDDTFLNGLRESGDPLADDAVARLRADHGGAVIGAIFAKLRANDSPLPPDAPLALADFMRSAGGLPSWASDARLQRGGQVFLQTPSPPSSSCWPPACRAGMRRRASPRSCRSRATSSSIPTSA